MRGPVLPRLHEADLRNPETHYRVRRLRNALAETVEWLDEALTEKEQNEQDPT